MRAYVHAYRTISNRATFEQGILEASKVATEEGLVHPVYKEFIPPALIRRMSKVIRVGVGLAISVKGDEELDGVIVGTGLGCLENTEKFMDQFVQKQDGMLAPTAFIQSTHNTIAGQIGLILKVNCYNSTYTQRGLSFENALLDAILLSMETEGSIVVGGVDEKIPLMDELGEKVGIDTSHVGEGGSFFRINQKPDGALAEICACDNRPFKPDQYEEVFQQFLSHHQLSEAEVLHGNSSLGNTFLADNWADTKNYSDLSGVYMTNSAYGLQLGIEQMQRKGGPKELIIANNYADRDLGLIYIRKK